MKVNLASAIIHPSGEPFKGEKGDYTVKEALMTGLATPQERMSSSSKVKRYELAIKIAASNDEVELSSEDIVELKKSIEETASPFVYGFINKFLG